MAIVYVLTYYVYVAPRRRAVVVFISHTIIIIMVRIWKRKIQTKEEIEQERKAIREQRELFELEILLQEEAVVFRELYLKWLDESVTLDDILKEMERNSICKRISPFIKKDTEAHTD